MHFDRIMRFGFCF